MKLLVTGASGFIGQNLVCRLLADGHSVRAVYRRAIVPPAFVDAEKAHPGRLELVRMDLDFPASMPDLRSPAFRSWCKAAKTGIPQTVPEYPIMGEDLRRIRELCAGMDGIFHSAARVGDWGSLQEFFASNVNPTRLLLEAAAQAGLSRFVLVISISVHGFGHNRRAREDDPFHPAGHPYQLSKRLAESLARQYVDRGLDVRVVRPGNVYGPGDTTTFYPLFEAMVGGANGTVGGGKSLTCPVFIDDLVDGIIRAWRVDTPAVRTVNLSSGESITWKRLFALASDALGLPRGWLNLPAWLAWVLAAGGEGLFRLFRRKNRPPFTFYTVAQLLHDYSFSTATAHETLGWQPATLAETGIPLTVEAWKRDRVRASRI